MQAKRILLLLLLALPLLAQNTILVGHGRTDGGSGIAGTVVPTADFHHSFDNDGGTGTTATADQGDDCTLSGPDWVSDDAGGFALSFDSGVGDTATCGSDLDAVNDGAV